MKKVITLMLSMVLLLGVLSACGEKKEEPAKEEQNEPVKEEVKTEEKKSVDREMEALKAYVNKLSQRDAKDESLDADTETDDKELF